MNTQAFDRKSSMNATGIPLKEPAISAAAGDTEQLERAYIDASTRVPVLIFYTSAIAWLILGTLLAMVRFVQAALTGFAL